MNIILNLIFLLLTLSHYCFIYHPYIITTMTEESADDLRLRIQQELVASGKYQEIYNMLKVELTNSGWFDKFKDLTNQTVSEKDLDGGLKLGDVIGQLESKGFEMVPDGVKVTILQKIKEFLDGVVV